MITVVDSHYAHWLADRLDCTGAETLISQRSWLWRKLIAVGGPVGGFARGLAISWGSRRADRIVLCDHLPGVATVLFLEAWLWRRRRIVLFELLLRHPPRTAWRRALYATWFKLVRRPAVTRSLLVGHVLTREEVGRYSALYKLDRERMSFIPWGWRQHRLGEGPAVPGSEREPDLVLSSGRAYCDWPVIFKAAESASWRLVAICSRHDLPVVKSLNASGRAEILCEISREEHARWLRRATVYAMPLQPNWVSAGHVRLMHATQAGLPVVATRSPALQDYVEEGETALIVEPSDASSLRLALDRVVAQPSLAQQLVTEADKHSNSWVMNDYLDALTEMVVSGKSVAVAPMSR